MVQITICAQQFISVDENIQLLHLKDSVFIHITWDETEKSGRFSSNGLIIIRNGKAIMIDTPMDNLKTEKLVVFLRDSMKTDVERLIIGHFHNDCLGGLDYINKSGIVSIANVLTYNKCSKLGLPLPFVTFADSMLSDFYGEKVVLRYFGKGHSEDNITVWLPREKILYGGCLIRPAGTNDLGNLSDAFTGEWGETVLKIIDKYKDVEYVIPGHGAHGNAELLYHTVKLALNSEIDRTSPKQ